MASTYKNDLELLANGELSSEASTRLPLLVTGELGMVRCAAQERASQRGASGGAAEMDEDKAEDNEDEEGP
jgi:hypothetical protein